MSNVKRVYRLEKFGPVKTGMQEMECNAEDFHSPIPTQTLHNYYNEEEIGLNVGVWTTTPMQEAFGPYPGDEFIWLLEGGFKMVDENNTLLDSYQEGDSVFFRNAAPVSWLQEENLRKFYITYLPPNRPTPENVPAKGAVQSVNPDITPDQMEVLETTAPFTIEGQKPRQRDYNYFTNDTEDMFVGMWDTESFESKMEAFPVYEFVQILVGTITITEENGTVNVFQKDECFFIPKGTICSWKVDGYVKKYYAMLDPK
ncbi:cupin domain-containing protein [Curvivirga sp.]|uniref:cupin domain-containing protein n=1 Tax=Curvivirga sp. TaxID=2856848 RepID=UPI003B5B4118